MGTDKNLNLECSILIKQISTAIQTRVDNELREYNLAHSQIMFLDYIYNNGKSNVPLKKVQLYLAVSRPSISAITSRLVEKEFITIDRSQTDNRTKLVTLTAKGEKGYLKSKEYAFHIPVALNEEELSVLYDLLSKINLKLQSNDL